MSFLSRYNQRTSTTDLDGNNGIPSTGAVHHLLTGSGRLFQHIYARWRHECRWYSNFRPRLRKTRIKQ